MVFDFDEWARLAREDAAAFEQRRRAALAATLARIGGGQRLAGLQFRIDMERRRAKTPLKSWLRLSRLMWQSFHKLNDRLNRRVELGPRRRQRTESPCTAAVVYLAARRPQRHGIPDAAVTTHQP